MANVLQTLQHHLPRLRPVDMLAGAAVGGLTGAAVDQFAPGDEESGQRKRWTRPLLGAVAGAGLGALAGDRARRYLVNNLSPIGYRGDAMKQLQPKSVGQVFKTLIQDEPAEFIGGPRSGLIGSGAERAGQITVSGASTDVQPLTNPTVRARYELFRRALGLPVKNPDQSFFRDVGVQPYSPTASSGGLPGNFRTVEFRPEALAKLQKTDPATRWSMKELQQVVDNPRVGDKHWTFGSLLARHGYQHPAPGKVQVEDLWDFALNPAEDRKMYEYLRDPLRLGNPVSDWQEGLRSGKYDNMSIGKNPTRLQHLLGMLQRKAMNDLLLDRGGVVFRQGFERGEGGKLRPTFQKESGQSKTANSKLRAMIAMQQLVRNGIRNWRMTLKGQDIGGAFAKQVPGGWQLGGVDTLPKQFQGMGLGKKLYGEILKSLSPGEKLFSDAQVSPGAQAVWQSLQRRVGPWAVTRQPGGVVPPPTRDAAKFKLPGLMFPGSMFGSAGAMKPHHFSAERLPFKP